MPLKKGRSERTMDENRRELWEKYRRTGEIHGIRPRNDEHARQIIEAIVHRQAGRSRRAWLPSGRRRRRRRRR